jgi:hypothetical protein
MNFRIPSLPEIKSIPEYAYDALVREIERFQGALTDEMEVGIIANGAGLTIHVDSLRFSGQMIVFSGVDGEGRQARLIQHYTQANVQMIAVQKLSQEPRRIGF